VEEPGGGCTARRGGPAAEEVLDGSSRRRKCSTAACEGGCARRRPTVEMCSTGAAEDVLDGSLQDRGGGSQRRLYGGRRVRGGRPATGATGGQPAGQIAVGESIGGRGDERMSPATDKEERRKRKKKRKEKIEKCEVINRKGKRKIKRKVLWTYHFFIHITQLEEAVLSNIFLKQFQIHQKIYFTTAAIVHSHCYSYAKYTLSYNFIEHNLHDRDF
jgi:hypothetical protein